MTEYSHKVRAPEDKVLVQTNHKHFTDICTNIQALLLSILILYYYYYHYIRKHVLRYSIADEWIPCEFTYYCIVYNWSKNYEVLRMTDHCY